MAKIEITKAVLKAVRFMAETGTCATIDCSNCPGSSAYNSNGRGCFGNGWIGQRRGSNTYNPVKQASAKQWLIDNVDNNNDGGSKMGFSKSDLKSGMLIELRDGRVRMVIGDVFSGPVAYGDISSYNNELICTGVPNGRCDIVRVSNVIDTYYVSVDCWTKKTITDNLLWERKKEVPTYTMEEIAKMIGDKEFKIKK